MGKSPKEVGAALRFANPYEEILKSAAVAWALAFLLPIVKHELVGLLPIETSHLRRDCGQSDIKTYGSDNSNTSCWKRSFQRLRLRKPKLPILTL